MATGSEDIRFTGMGFSVEGNRVLTYVPTWEDGRPSGARTVSIPQQSVDTAAGTSKAMTTDLPSFDDALDAVFQIQCGQRKLTSPFSSPYIDKPIRTFFVKGWVATMELDQHTLMNDAAILNYALGLSRGQGMGLIERTYREARHLVADLAMMVALAAQAELEGDGDLGDGRKALLEALSDPDANVLWVVGSGWLCCWHDHMATKKDFSSGILKAWFSQVESPLKVPSPMTMAEYATPEGIAEVSAIGLQCLRSCWVISDADGSLSDVMESEESWEEMFARERDYEDKVMTVDMMTAEVRAELEGEQPEDEDAPDDIIPESMMSLKRDIESMTPQDIDPDE